MLLLPSELAFSRFGAHPCGALTQCLLALPAFRPYKIGSRTNKAWRTLACLHCVACLVSCGLCSRSPLSAPHAAVVAFRSPCQFCCSANCNSQLAAPGSGHQAPGTQLLWPYIHFIVFPQPVPYLWIFAQRKLAIKGSGN